MNNDNIIKVLGIRTTKLRLLRFIIANIASLKLTVVLLTLSMLLVLFGTLAQINGGMWEMMNHYFRSWLVWCEFDLIGQAFKYDKGTLDRIYGMPLPGGRLLGVFLFVNLISAHVIRWKFNKKRIGIILIHLSIVLLLMGELIVSFAQTEGMMAIPEGSQASIYRDRRYVELMVVEVNEGDHANEKMVLIPHNRLLKSSKREITSGETGLPFDIFMNAMYPNADVQRSLIVCLQVSVRGIVLTNVRLLPALSQVVEICLVVL